MDNIRKYLNIILLALCVVLGALLFRQCERNKNANNEIIRKQHNIEALNDTVRIYRYNNGISMGEIQAMELKLDELADSLYTERKKKPITIVENTLVIHDTFYLPTIVDTIHSVFTAYDFKSWSRSYRYIKTETPYTFGDTLILDDTKFTIDERIWTQTSIIKNERDGKYYVQVKSDIPYVMFDDMSGIAVDDFITTKPYSYRKTFGIGIQLGFGGVLTNNGLGFGPYVGIGINYTPKWLQF